MNEATVAEKRPFFEPVNQKNRCGPDQRIKTYKHKDTLRILFPDIGHPLAVLFEFIQIQIPHLVLGTFLGYCLCEHNDAMSTIHLLTIIIAFPRVDMLIVVVK